MHRRTNGGFRLNALVGKAPEVPLPTDAGHGITVHRNELMRHRFAQTNWKFHSRRSRRRFPGDPPHHSTRARPGAGNAAVPQIPPRIRIFGGPLTTRVRASPWLATTAATAVARRRITVVRTLVVRAEMAHLPVPSADVPRPRPLSTSVGNTGTDSGNSSGPSIARTLTPRYPSPTRAGPPTVKHETEQHSCGEQQCSAGHTVLGVAERRDDMPFVGLVGQRQSVAEGEDPDRVSELCRAEVHKDPDRRPEQQRRQQPHAELGPALRTDTREQQRHREQRRVPPRSTLEPLGAAGRGRPEGSAQTPPGHPSPRDWPVDPRHRYGPRRDGRPRPRTVPAGDTRPNSSNRTLWNRPEATRASTLITPLATRPGATR